MSINGENKVHVAYPLIGSPKAKQGKTVCGLDARNEFIQVIGSAVLKQRIGKGETADICRRCMK